MNNVFKGIIGAALLCASSLALAVPMHGGISFSSLPDSNFTFDTTNNTFDFDDNTPNGNAKVNSIKGDFANYFAKNNLATFFDFSYGPFAGPQTIWEGTSTVGANSGSQLSFILDNVNVKLESDDMMAISGFGTLTDGVNETTGTWNVTANQGGGTFSWSSSTATDVPEPGTLALLGLGLAGLGAARRRQKA